MLSVAKLHYLIRTRFRLSGAMWVRFLRIKRKEDQFWNISPWECWSRTTYLTGWVFFNWFILKYPWFLAGPVWNFPITLGKQIHHNYSPCSLQWWFVFGFFTVSSTTCTISHVFKHHLSSAMCIRKPTNWVHCLRENLSACEVKTRHCVRLLRRRSADAYMAVIENGRTRNPLTLFVVVNLV